MVVHKNALRKSENGTAENTNTIAKAKHNNINSKHKGEFLTDLTNK